ncbi:Rab3 GTPase-activating protein non-catalytic subunit [Araneus ventricosus]|uniref:Rab3 GTPase-activating protein non-catalytic subunit n=1 Tax=Araneus ventricosus TaxID=182803 RepID=A0A4Y2RGS3_ARAVE|nr:Rab3 GTPase-activating protein non-catalytic subunit [Araneus ventricosus]
MSCHLSKRAVLSNIRSLKSALKFGDESVTPDDYSAESWNNDWDFEDPFEGKGTEAIKLKGGEQSWMQECLASLSPMVDVLALGHLQQAVFFTSKWNAAEESEVKLKFVPSFEGKLSVEKDENITSILCLPLASQKRSLQGGPDWTCIIVGFSSGYIRIYTENAEQLLSQKFHEEPVEHLKCKTHVPNHFSNYSDQPDELVIVFSTVVVTVDGFGLFQTLRACRNQLARATAGRQEVVQPPPLTYKKWGFHEHDKLIDCEAAVFFLVIYAPRRGILEVWCSQQGPRVAAFNVGKSGRLFCPGYTIVGGNFSTALMKDRLCSCYFLDVDGVLKKIIVPFHLILRYL